MVQRKLSRSSTSRRVARATSTPIYEGLEPTHSFKTIVYLRNSDTIPPSGVATGYSAQYPAVLRNSHTLPADTSLKECL